MQLHNQVGFMFSFGLCFFLNISQILQNSFTKIKMYSLSTTWSKVTKNYQHFRWNKRCAQSNLLNYIALCDILQTFKTFHIALNYISVIMASRPVCLTAVAVFCFPIVKLLNQSYLDTMVIGMPRLYWENPPCKKLSQFLHASRESTLLWLPLYPVKTELWCGQTKIDKNVFWTLFL